MAPTHAASTDEDPTGPRAWLVTGDDGRPTLLGGWSASGGRAHFPPADRCPYTGADDVEVRPCPGQGPCGRGPR